MREVVFIFFFLSFLMLGYAQQQGTLYAVIVGVFEYQQSANNLMYSHQDAQKMYNLLKLQTTPSNLKLLTNRKIIFADACLSGTFRTPNQSSTTHTNADAGEHVLLFLSSRSNQYSRESPSIKNGVFTYFLIAGLKGGADTNNDRIITAKELFDFVNPKVKEMTNGQQVPVMWGKFEDTMTLLSWKNGKQ